MSSSNNEDHPIFLIQIIRLVFGLTIWVVNTGFRLLIWLCLLQLRLFLWITILGIPIAIMIFEWEKNTLNPVLDKWFNTNLLDLINEA